MSGGLFDFSAIGMLVLKNSFWCGTFWMVTFGCAVWKAVMALTQTPLSGSAVALFHQLRVTREPALELVDEFEPAEVPLLLLHAAIVAAAAATAMATMTGFGERRMRLSSPDDAGISAVTAKKDRRRPQVTPYQTSKVYVYISEFPVIIGTVRSSVNPSFLRCYVPALRYAGPG